jgi:hypothetical protein
MNVFEKAFGGISVILAGDFAQLPPVGGNALYSREVAFRQSRGQTKTEQENTIGRGIWLQFTAVVILTENMRQTGMSDTQVQFRQALENL